VPRTLSSVALQAIYTQETGTAFIVLLTISHPSLNGPIRVTSDAVQTISRSNTFLPFPFLITIPDDEQEKLPQASISIDNVDRSIVSAVRSMGTSPAGILIELVTSIAPDTVEFSSGELTLRDVHYDALTVTGTLSFEAILAEPFPGDLVTPATMPGVFLSQ
jgi:hypothetical protein